LDSDSKEIKNVLSIERQECAHNENDVCISAYFTKTNE